MKGHSVPRGGEAKTRWMAGDGVKTEYQNIKKETLPLSLTERSMCRDKKLPKASPTTKQKLVSSLYNYFPTCLLCVFLELVRR